MEVTDDFYVYMYCKPDGTPFYIGKGKEDRWEHHIKQAKKQRTTDSNKLKINTIRKILKQGQEPLIKFIDTDLSEDQAFELEQFMIGWIGRFDLGTGTLTNMTNGGEGSVGRIVTEKERKERSIRSSGKNNPNYGKKDSPEMIELKRKRMLGRVMGACTDEHRENIKKATTGVKKSNTENMKKPRRKVICPYCNKEGGSNTMHRWHFDNCKLKEKIDAS